MIHDRDTKYSLRFRLVMESAGIETIKTPFQAPNANAYAERFVLSIKSECLGRMISFGEASLQRAISEFTAHYHEERAHQGVGNVRLDGCNEPTRLGPVICSERLGGLLKSYSRAA